MTDRQPNSEHALSPTLDADLAQRLGSLESKSAGGFKRVRMMKEHEGEATELVTDDEGKLFVRKCFPCTNPAPFELYEELSRIQSPLLPRVVSVRDTPDGTETIREYVEGPTLRAWVDENGPLADAAARDILIQIARAVQVLHAGCPPIIHRDLNPSNIVMGPNGPRIIDFGIARTFKPEEDRDTHTWGTYGYAAPEQFGFGQSDARTDIFALGMLYWFLLTGTEPTANLNRQLAADTASAPGRQPIPDAARQIIATCTAIAPENRFADIGTLIEALQTAGKETAEANKPKKFPTVRSLLEKAWLAASSTFMGIICLGGLINLFSPWRLAYPEAFLRAVGEIVALLLIFAPTWLLSTNLFGIRSRLPLLRRHCLRRSILLIAARIVLGIVVTVLVTSDLSPEYLQLMAANGVDTV